MLITSVNNKKVLEWAKLKQSKHQKKLKKFIIEEELLIKEALKANLKCEIIRREGFDCKADYVVSDAVMRKISHNVSLNDVVAVCDFFEVKKSETSKIIYLDNVSDPGNVGTIIRSAYSFGFDLVVLANNSVNKYNHKLISATKGAMFFIPVVSDIDLLEYKKTGFKLYTTDLNEKAYKLSEVNNEEKVIIVLGNEGSGVSEEINSLADKNIYIEMNNFDSLNVGVSGGIIMYHFRNRKE